MKYLQILMPNVNIERNYLLLIKYYVSKYKNHAITIYKTLKVTYSR